jgi:aryl-alcohol dehydrogenase-like predicted oxidoreductase
MGEFIGGFMKPDLLRAVQQIKGIAEEAGLSLAQFSLAWVLREPNVASAITGASRPEQVFENAGASSRSVDPEIFARVEEIIAEAKSKANAA